MTRAEAPYSQQSTAKSAPLQPCWMSFIDTSLVVTLPAFPCLVSLLIEWHLEAVSFVSAGITCLEIKAESKRFKIPKEEEEKN